MALLQDLLGQSLGTWHGPSASFSITKDGDDGETGETWGCGVGTSWDKARKPRVLSWAIWTSGWKHNRGAYAAYAAKICEDVYRGS